tara:strand:+ start:913 stop:1506 length:594 start_codon:yes stop_codon:yes gene_type:complete
MADFVLAHKKVHKAEGGYSNNPNDSGNYVDGYLVGSNFGISAPVLKNQLGKRPTVEDMRGLSPKLALLIYKNEYWNKIQGDYIKNQSVAHLLYDGAVNQGYSFMRSAIKKAVLEQGEEYEGINANQINSLNQREFFYSVFRDRLDRYYSGKKEFRKGWIKRLNQIRFIPTRNAKYYLIGGILAIGLLSAIILIKVTE